MHSQIQKESCTILRKIWYGKICNVSKKKNSVKLTRRKLLLNYQAWITIMANHLFSLHISQIIVFGIVLFFQSDAF